MVGKNICPLNDRWFNGNTFHGRIRKKSPTKQLNIQKNLEFQWGWKRSNFFPNGFIIHWWLWCVGQENHSTLGFLGWPSPPIIARLCPWGSPTVGTAVGAGAATPGSWLNLTTQTQVEHIIFGWWLNQPIWSICSSNWVHLPPNFGVKIKHIWNHHLVFLGHVYNLQPSKHHHPRFLWAKPCPFPPTSHPAIASSSSEVEPNGVGRPSLFLRVFVSQRCVFFLN